MISSTTKTNFTIGALAAAAATLLYTGWTANDRLRDIKDELYQLRKEMRSSWTVRDMKDYSASLAINNPSLKTPDVAKIQQDNHQ